MWTVFNVSRGSRALGRELASGSAFALRRSERIAKRAFDVSVGGLVMLVMAPLLLFIAIAIKLESRGPIFFRQTRVAGGGGRFELWKFRSMVGHAEARKALQRADNEAADGLFKIADDHRVTRVGRVIRRLSLDEMPQLFNVLRGEMSLVGPRPLVCDEGERTAGWDRGRLHLMPGMTGPWQILASSRVPLSEMVKLDYLYVAGWSLWSDGKILLWTVGHVLARRGM